MKGITFAMMAAGLLVPELARARTLTASISIQDHIPKTIVRDVSDPRWQQWEWKDQEDRTCRALLDADDLGDRVFTVIKVRCTDKKGGVILDSSPNVIMPWNENATITVNGDGTTAQSDRPKVTVALESSTNGQEPQQTTLIHRSFFIDSGRSTYSWGAMIPGVSTFACADEVKVKVGAGWITGRDSGRYRPGVHKGAVCTMTSQDGSTRSVQVELAYF